MKNKISGLSLSDKDPIEIVLYSRLLGDEIKLIPTPITKLTILFLTIFVSIKTPASFFLLSKYHLALNFKFFFFGIFFLIKKEALN